MRSEGAINSHERFEELAALALIGELSAAEHQELEVHFKSCAACLQEYRDFDAILTRALPLLHHEQSSLEAREPHGFAEVNADTFATVGQDGRVGRKRELPRRPEDGLTVGSIRAGLLRRLPEIAYGVSAILLIAIAVFVFVMRAQSREAQRQIAALKERISFSSKEAQAHPPVPVPAPPKQVRDLPSQAENQGAHLAQRGRELEQQLKSSAEEVRNLKDQLQTVQESDRALAQRVSETEQQLEKASAELQATLRDREQTSVDLKNKETELIALAQEVATLRESVERDRALLAASYDITNLMGARNLRIIDVSDVDGKGKTRKAFGRVFFTEGKSLVFYAFDLADTKSSARPASFQAWGSQGANLPGAKSLGIFFHDDRNTNRWVLQFDDSRVLSEIDSVFVTVEPPGGSKKPTGTPLLPAYLKAELNHP